MSLTLARTSRLAYRLLRTAALEDRIQLLEKKYPGLSEEEIRILAAVDPTGGKYTEWLVRQVATGELDLEEVTEKPNAQTAEMLNFYQKATRSPEMADYLGISRDISGVKFYDLYRWWIRNRKVDLTSTAQRAKQAKKEGARLIYDQNGFKIIQVGGPGTNPELAPIAACMYAKNTRWCTSKEEVARDRYLSQGPLYVIFHNGEKVLQTDKKEFKKPEGDEIDLIETPELTKLLVDTGLLDDPEKVMRLMYRDSYRQRWPEVEPLMARTAEWALAYAKRSEERFPLGEKVLAQDVEKALEYVFYVLKGPFPEAEATLKQYPEEWEYYTDYIQSRAERQKRTQAFRPQELSRTLRIAYRLILAAASENRINYMIKAYPNVPEGDIRKFADADPSDGKYLEWLVRNHKTLFMKHHNPATDEITGELTNLYIFTEMLKFYQKVSRSPKLLEMVGLSPDINRIELGDLMRAWLDWKDKDLESERKRQERAKKEGARLIYNQDGYKVIQVGGTGTDPELASIAACIYGKNTKWCTSNEETAKGYLRRGPLYIVIKDGKNVLQTNLREFKDPQNVDINILKNQEFTQVLIDSGVFSDPKKVWDVIGTIGLQQHQRWPLVEPILAQDAWVACEYARLINEPFPLGEEVIARDTDASFLYAIGALNRRFPAGEAAIKRDPEKWGTYQKYFDTLEKIGQEPTR